MSADTCVLQQQSCSCGQSRVLCNEAGLAARSWIMGGPTHVFTQHTLSTAICTPTQPARHLFG